MSSSSTSSTSAATSINIGDLVHWSDVIAAGVGAAHAQIYGGTRPGMQAAQSFVVSVMARVMSNKLLSEQMKDMTPQAKNQLLVGMISAAIAAFRKQSVARSAFTGVSVDLLAEEVLRMFKFNDSGLFSSS